MRILYDIGIRIYWLIILFVSLWNRKARLWLKGRRNWYGKIRKAFQATDRVIWFHCASLGEFEQGRPVLEACREQFPGHRILLTFFSPSGYEKRKNYSGADHVMYLPLDTGRNARRFLGTVAPEMAVFIKYEFWYHFLKRMNRKGIPVFLASGIFRPGQLFFRWYGGWYRNFLGYFTHIFVQQQASAELLEKHGVGHVTVAGDTRFDRVSRVACTAYEHPAMEAFTSGKVTIVAGSTWEKDEQLLEKAFREFPGSVRWIIAPHELSEAHMDRLRRRFPGSVLFTGIEKEVPPEVQVVIVDTIGRLSFLYRFGTIAYLGGGFGKGIHNILEAAVYGMPVIFGPEYTRFYEAVELVRLGGAFPVRDEGELLSTIHQHMVGEEMLKRSSQISKEFVYQGAGATDIIMNRLCKNITGDVL